MSKLILFCTRLLLYLHEISALMDKQVISLCPACGSERIHTYVSATDYYATGETFDVYECDACGMRFTQNTPIEAESARYYSSPDYISHTDINKGLFNRTYHAVRAIMLRRKAHLVMKALGSKEGRLLDIGAGTGYFAREMQRCGFSVEAVEINEAARKVAAEKAGITERPVSALATFESESFDAITMWHVMEHVYNLADEWQTLRRLLKSDGRLIIAVPNCASTDAQYYKESWAAYDVPRHLWHFSPHTMKLIAEQYGFRIMDIHPMPFDAYYVSMLSEKYRGHSPYFIRGMAFGIYSWFKAQCDKEKSSSLIYVMKKL